MTKATSNDIVTIVVTLVLIVIIGAIGISIADTTVTETALQPEDVAATGTLTFTGDIVDAETVTIEGIVFEFNASGAPAAAGHVEINTAGNLTAAFATDALNTSINNNASTNAIVTSTNPTSSTVSLTAATSGTAGNSITTTETLTNATWTSSHLTGGLDKSQLSGMQDDILGAGSTGASFIVILVITIIGGAAMGYMHGFISKK